MLVWAVGQAAACIRLQADPLGPGSGPWQRTVFTEWLCVCPYLHAVGMLLIAVESTLERARMSHC